MALQDEAACIGCKQCVWCASGVFRMEPEYGRSRAFAQWCDTEDRIQVRSLGLPSSLSVIHHQANHCGRTAFGWAQMGCCRVFMPYQQAKHCRRTASRWA